MKSSRYWSICTAIACTLVFQLFGFLFGGLGDPYGGVDAKVYFDSDLDTLSSKLNNTYVTDIYNDRMQPYRVVASTKEAAVFVITSNDDYQYDITKYSEVEIGTSPIIAVLPGKINSRDNGYEEQGVSVQGNSTNYWFKYDVKKILMECINSTDGSVDLSKLGFDVKDLKNNSVKIAIPDVMYSSRKDVVNALLYILNDGEDIVDDGNIDPMLAENFNKLMDNVTTFSISDLSNPSSNKDEIIFMPEFYLGKSGQTRPLYYDNMCNVKIKMIYPNEYTGDDLDKSLYKASVVEFIDNLKNSENVKKRWIRNNIKWNDQGSYMRNALTVSTRYAEGNLSEVLGNKYWKTGELRTSRVINSPNISNIPNTGIN